MNHQKLAHELIENLGGKANISQSWHCITRLRFNVNDKKKVNVEKIDGLSGVIGSQFQGGQYQIIIGAEVENVFEEIDKILGTSLTSSATKEKSNPLNAVFDLVSGIFNPILPAIVGGGLLKGIMALLTFANVLSEQSSSYEVLNFIADAPFHFLPFLIAFSAARKFKASPSLVLTLAGVLMYPNFMAYAGAGEISRLIFFGLPIPVNSYASSVLPIILGAWLMSVVEKNVKKIVPNSLTIVFVPLLTLIITAPLVLAVLAPIGNFLGVYLERIFTTLFDVAGPLAGALMGGLMPLIVVTGMHYAFFPGAFASLEKFGYDVMLLPMNFVANMAQAGATLGVFFKTKNPEMKQLSISSFIPAIFGITEPAIYGVTMKLKKPLYSSMIGGAVGGAIYGLLKVKAFSFTLPGITSIFTYLEKGTSNFIFAVIGITASFIVSLLMTMVLGFEDEQMESTTGTERRPSVSGDSSQPIDVIAPVSGEVVEIERVKDKTFADQLMGKGIAVMPTEGVVYSPFDGVVSMITPTNHAIGVTSSTGAEVLIHIGLETVELNGTGFKLLVSETEPLTVGQPLIEFDLALLKEKKIDPIIPIVVTNSSSFLDVIPTTHQQVTAKENTLLMIIQ